MGTRGVDSKQRPHLNIFAVSRESYRENVELAGATLNIGSIASGHVRGIFELTINKGITVKGHPVD
jgi:hypothetical protein